MIDVDVEVEQAFNEFGLQLYAELISTMPVDTRNMLSHTRMTVSDNLIQIVISGPTKKGFDYAYNVDHPAFHGPKADKNRGYVERAINKTARIVASNNGGTTNEL